MKTLKRLNIKDKPGYYFMNVTNIDDLDPEFLLFNKFTIIDDLSIMFDVNYCEQNNTPNVVFNNIEYVFKKSGIFSCLIFCETEKNKEMLDKYTKVIDGIKEEILFIEDKGKEMGKDFMRFKFKTGDNLVYNQKINVPVCVISISGQLKERGWYYPQIELQECFYENEYFDKK